ASPECSPSRVSFFTGRYPLRHHVVAALLPPDQAISQPSPFETTTPNILRSAGYRSALLGKSHFTNSPTNPQDPSTDPYQGTAVTQLGWDYYKGWFDGGPNSIDTTAGGIGDENAETYKCGYIPTKAIDPDHGANAGACYKPDGACRYISTASDSTPGLTCLASGGILKPDANCGGLPPELNFSAQNGYYVGQRVEDPARGKAAIIKQPSSPASRGYRTTLEANYAIQWINSQSKKTPWMTTIAFSAAHTPYQPAPRTLVYSDIPRLGNDCSDSSVDSRLLMTQMGEAMDKELGRVLVETRLATRNIDGTVNFDPKKANTVIVVVGDNGSFAGNVRLPFDPSESKGTVYQTGLWVPMIIAGPMVVSPNRSVESMTNVVDLFGFFGDVAGIDVRKAVAATHGLDSKPLLPYLTNPDQDNSPIRTSNFAQYQPSVRSSTYVSGTCVIKSVNTCITLMPTREPCEDNGGTWYGTGTTEDIPVDYKIAHGFTQCCQVNQWIQQFSPVDGNGNLLELVSEQSDYSYAVRNGLYKLIRKSVTDYDPALPDLGNACKTIVSDEFYSIDQMTGVPTIDRPDGPFKNNELAPNTPPGEGTLQLTGVLQENYDRLVKVLAETLDSYKDCPGDANLDAVVNNRDLKNQTNWMRKTKGASTWWDMNLDGHTNSDDQQALAMIAATQPCSLSAGQTR
ncbi:MAG: sulfatase-like hydrolase/transferase, partial [Alphaproteobacteria bacterium]|nr:sulfatase-like hydrolase/transferase [Alphaproteobacteria bacterium]